MNLRNHEAEEKRALTIAIWRYLSLYENENCDREIIFNRYWRSGGVQTSQQEQIVISSSWDPQSPADYHDVEYCHIHNHPLKWWSYPLPTCWTGNGRAYDEWNTSVYIFQYYSGKLSASLKIFQQMLKHLFDRNKIFAQIVFQVYLDFNNAHTHWYKQRLFISSQNVHSLFWVRGSFGFVNFWNPWRFEERDQICPVLIPWQESCADIKFLSFSRNIKNQQTLTFLEAVKAEVANPPRLHVDVGQRCLVGGTQTARLKCSLEALFVQL